jgi:hypothetical protein
VSSFEKIGKIHYEFRLEWDLRLTHRNENGPHCAPFTNRARRINHVFPKVKYIPRKSDIRTDGHTRLINAFIIHMLVCELLSNSGQHLKNRTMTFAIFV